MAFTGVLLREKIAISMDGRGAWRDNVVVERLWRSVKYEEVYLKAYGSVSEARAGIGRYCAFTMRSGHIRAWGPERPTKPILTICPRQWRHDFGRWCGPSFQSGYALLPCRAYQHMKTTTRRRSTYPWPIAVQANRATSAGHGYNRSARWPDSGGHLPGCRTAPH